MSAAVALQKDAVQVPPPLLESRKRLFPQDSFDVNALTVGASLLLLIGGELNAVLARREDPEYRAEQGVKPQASGSRAQP